MIAETGHYALVLALVLALVQASVPIVGARKNDPVLMAVAGPTAVAQFCFIALAFAALTMCYVRSDFSVVNVFENSHSAKPLIYKLSGVWGNHEGSMLLWVLILSVFGALVALFGANLPARLKANVLAVQSSIAVAFILFILGAYYTLGWGGWWFWDPVENASFMPWLAATALLHSALVMEKRDALKVWTILLAILAFSLSLIGTFLVRSGVLTSVHAFATDPTRGVFILAILLLFIGGSLALFALRAPLLKQGGLFAPISREGALVLNNLFLVSACATVFIGTLYPLVLEALTGEKISVGAPFFNATFAPLFVPLLIAMPFGPLLAWKRGDLLGVAQRLVGAAGIAAIAVAVIFAMEGGGPLLVPFAIGLALYVMAGALTEILERTGLLKVPLATAFARARGLPRSAWGAAFAHFGLGITLLGVIGETQWSLERVAELKPGQSISIRRYDLHFDGVAARQGPNYRELAAHFTVRRHGDLVGVMEPAKHSFPSRGTATTETALMTRGVSQLYLSLGDPNPDGSLAVRLYYKPLVLLIWFGAVVMVIGGALSLSDRRLRVGAPKPARSKAALSPAE